MFTVVELFRKGAGRFNRRGAELVGINLVATSLLLALVYVYGEQQRTIDAFDILFEAGSCLVHFVMFFVCVFIRLKKHIRWKMLIGMFLTQTGLVLDFIDEFVFIDTVLWHKIGDVCYFFGITLAAIGVISWVSYAYQISMQDGLTRLYNRRFFEGYAQQYLMRLLRNPEPASFMSLDLDNFKAINDTYGHSRGDKVLRVVADALRESTRKQDLICRSGGEEFEILLTGTGPQQAVILADRIKQQLHKHTPQDMPTITASIGITGISTEDSVDSVRVRADTAMYQAKRNGKNQYVIQ